MRTLSIAKLLILVALLFAFVTTKAQIGINTNFEVFSAQPIDNRLTLPTLADTTSVGWPFEGLTSFVADVDQFWYYTGSYWKKMTQLDGRGLANYMAFWVNDTTLDETLIQYSSTQLIANTLTGSFRLPTGTTAQRPGTPIVGDTRLNSSLGAFEFYNGTQWRSLVEAMAGTFTSGEFAYFNSSGVLSDTSAAGLLSMISGLSGSGASPRLPVYSGANTFTNYATLTASASSLSAYTANNTYPLEVGTGGMRLAPQSADPSGASGVSFFDSDDLWFKGFNGTQYWFYGRTDDVDPGAGRLWFQNSTNTAQSTSANALWDNTNGILQIGIVKTGHTPYTIDILPPVTAGAQTNVSIGTTYDHGGSGNTVSGVAIGVNSKLLGATSSGSATAVGANAEAESSSSAFGEDATASGQYSIAIGRNSLASHSGTTAVGHGAQATAVNKPVAVGHTAIASNQWVVAVGSETTVSGQRSVGIGAQITITHTDALAVGKNATTTANEQAVFSSFNSGSNGYTDVYFGSGVQRNAISDGNGTSYTINGSGARGTNFTGGNVTIAAGKSTGTGVPADIIFSTSDAVASGSTLQTLAQRVWIKGETGQVGIGVSSPNAAALLQMDSTTQGFLPPRMTTAQRDAITAVQGLVIFNTTTTKLECYDGATWQAAW